MLTTVRDVDMVKLIPPMTEDVIGATAFETETDAWRGDASELLNAWRRMHDGKWCTWWICIYITRSVCAIAESNCEYCLCLKAKPLSEPTGARVSVRRRCGCGRLEW